MTGDQSMPKHPAPMRDHDGSETPAPGTRPAIVRFAQDPGELSEDSVSTHRGADLFLDEEGVFEIRVRLRLDRDAMPVADAAKEWSEAQSPYRTVARLVLPAQDATSEGRRADADDVLSFRSAHSLAAHRPLGSLMRARLKTYRALSNFRHARNATPEQEPRTLDEVPA